METGCVEYFHILLDRHEILFAEGAPSESFLPGEVGLSAMDAENIAAIQSVFPELQDNPQDVMQAARPKLKKHEALALLSILPMAA